MVTRTSVGFCAKAVIDKLSSKKFRVTFISFITILVDFTKLNFCARDHKPIRKTSALIVLKYTLIYYFCKPNYRVMSFKDEILKRRTFAVIAHPDAGKTTLTEKLLL